MQVKMPEYRDLAKAVRGRLVAGEESAGRRPAGVSTDTRTLKKGEVFVALKGARFDGHAYLFQAAERGASGAVVSNLEVGALERLNGSGLVVINREYEVRVPLELPDFFTLNDDQYRQVFVSPAAREWLKEAAGEWVDFSKPHFAVQSGGLTSSLKCNTCAETSYGCA